MSEFSQLHKPPLIAEKILGVLLVKDEWATPLGDFEEFFNDVADTDGLGKARLWYWGQVIRLVPEMLKEKLFWSLVMFTNYLKIALRNCLKSRWSSLINVLSLTIGVVCSIFIFLYVAEEFSHESFHKNKENIYRTVSLRKAPDGEVSYAPLFSKKAIEVMNKVSPDIEATTAFSVSATNIQIRDKFFNEMFALAGKDFFKVFTFPLVAGNPDNVLTSPDSLVITKEMADKFFGKPVKSYAEMIGKTVKLHSHSKKYDKDYIVSGVMENVPDNSSMNFGFVIHTENINRYGQSNNDYGNRTLYFLLKEGADPVKIEKALETLNTTVYGSVIKEQQKEKLLAKSADCLRYRLQPLTDVYMGEEGTTYLNRSSEIYSFILMGIGALILILACMNFISLSFGQAISKAGEIGVRKTLGATRVQIILQHVVESGLLIFTSIVSGIILTVSLMPFFNNMARKNLSVGLENSIGFLLFILGTMVVFTTFAAGIPALFISKFQPGRILGRLLKPGEKSRVTSILVMTQFFISIVLLISTFIMSEQMAYVESKDLGFNKENLMVVRVPYMAKDKIKQVFHEHHEILSIGGTDRNFSNGSSTRQFKDEKGTAVMGNIMRIDEDYIRAMKMSIVKGRGFSKDFPGDKLNSIIVNQKMVDKMGWTDPIGKVLRGESSFEKAPVVVGVVEDFNFESVKNEINPVVMHMNRSYGGFSLIMRIKPGDTAPVLKKLEGNWKQLVPDKPFSYTFLDDDMNNKYKGENRWKTITGFASVLAFIISSLGLIGLVAIMINYRVKEIGIRKVLGSSIASVVYILVKDFTKWVVYANIIAWPVAYFIMNSWLSGYAYRIDIDFTAFFVAGFTALAIAVLSVSFQTINAARVNPVKSLKSE